MGNPEADVVKFLEKLIEKNKGNFKKQGDFVVRPGIAYDRFDLTAIQGSWDMSLQGLVHHFLYEKGHYKKLLPADEFKKCEAIVKKDPENIVLLNPLSVLEKTEKEKFNINATLYLAETGNAFGYVDV